MVILKKTFLGLTQIYVLKKWYISSLGIINEGNFWRNMENKYQFAHLSGDIGTYFVRQPETGDCLELDAKSGGPSVVAQSGEVYVQTPILLFAVADELMAIGLN